MTAMVDDAASEIRDLIRKVLRERFADELDFGPIVVLPRFDDDGEEYLHSYIVFDGDQKKLDPTWTLRLSRRLWSRAEELGYPGIPIQLFVKKSEWPALAKRLA